MPKYPKVQIATSGSHPKYLEDVSGNAPDAEVDLSGNSRKIIIATSGSFPKIKLSYGRDPDVENILDRMTTVPDSTRQALYNTFITGWKSAGLWDDTEIMYITAADTVGAARLNLRGNPAYDLSQVGTVTFTQDRGLTGNGTDGYHTTGYSATDATMRDSHFSMVWSGTDVSSTATDWGTNRIRISSRNGANMVTTSAASTTDSVANASSIGLFTITRGVSTGYSRYKNSTSLGDATQASTGTTTAVLTLGARGQATPDGFSTRRLQFAAFGKRLLTSGEVTSAYNLISAFMTAIGA